MKRGTKQSEEAKVRIRIARAGQIFSLETRKKMSLAHMGNKGCLGYKHSEEAKRHMSEAQKRIGNIPPSHLGVKRSEESKVRYREAMRTRRLTYGYINSSETRRKISEFAKSRRGWKHDELTKTKISKAHTGKVFSEEHRKNISQSRLGIKLSEEVRKHISVGHMGEKNHNWQGGKSFEPYTPEWTKTLRLAIRQRDNFTCQRCGITEEEHIDKTKMVLSVNHIDFDKSNCDPKNLNTLCASCNSVVNYNREYWTNYFQQKVCV